MHKLTLPVLVAAALAAGLVFARAEETIPPGAAVQAPLQLQPAPPPQPTTELPAALPLMPEGVPSPQALPEVSGTGAAVPAPTPVRPPEKGSAEQLRQAVRIRELQTQVLNSDPSIDAWRQLGDRARTPNGRRVAMRNYYTALYTRIEKIDPSLFDAIERILYRQLLMFEQHRLQPAKLIEAIAELPRSHSDDHKPPVPAGLKGKPAVPGMIVKPETTSDEEAVPVPTEGPDRTMEEE